MNIKDEHLEKLGFEYRHVTEEESGDSEFSYWSFDLSESNKQFCLLSCASDEKPDGEHWVVELMDVEEYVFTDHVQLEKFITSILESKRELIKD